jgi:hypothetical protein
MSLIDKINSVQAIALAGLERANNNVSMIQNIRITTGQILNFGSQVRASRIKHQSSNSRLKPSICFSVLLCL